MNELVQLGYLPLTTLQCIPDGGGRRIGVDWTSIRHESVGSMSGRRRSRGLCYVGSGCTYVFLYLYMVYVYVMQYLVCMKLNTRPHKFIHQYISHTSKIPIIHHLCPCQPRLFKKQTTSPHIKKIVCFIYATSFTKCIMYTWCIHAACFVH